MESDQRQNEFIEFEVPDKGRILKVKRGLEKKGFLRHEGEWDCLEIGYARGGLLDQITDDKVRKMALDLHPRQLAEGIEFVQHDLNRGLPDLGGRQFDVIFAGEVIEHIFDDRQFLENLKTLLKPGGALALTTPNLFFLVNRLVMPLGVMPYFAYEPYHYHFYSIPTLSKLVREVGLEISYTTSTHLLISTRRSPRLGRIFEKLGDWFPRFGAHIILIARKPE